MLDVLAEDLDPVMLTFFPHRIVGIGDVWIVERAKRDGDQVGIVAAAIMYGRAAFRAEMINARLSAVCCAGPFLRFTLDGDASGMPACLCREGASGPLLAGETMTDRHA